MTKASHGHAGPRPARMTLVYLFAALVIGGATGAGALALHTQHGSQLAARVPSGDRGTTADAAQVPSGFGSAPGSPTQAVGHVPPVEMAVPVLGIQSRLVGLRLNLDGSLQVPTDYSVAGWYSDGSAPGDTGAPAILVGHVDSKSGPGIFYRLPEMRIGDAVLVRRSDGITLRFVVYKSAEYLKRAFPSSQVYAPVATPEIRLITCTGAFDRSTGHYESNRVIYARLATTPPSSPRSTVRTSP